MADIEDSQGTIFIFDGVTFEATNVKKKKSGPDTEGNKIDVSTVNQASGTKRVYQDAPLIEDSTKGTEAVITVSFLGLTEPDTTEPHPITCEKLNISGMAWCTEYEVESAVGDVLKGTASFRIEAPETTSAPAAAPAASPVGPELLPAISSGPVSA
jgi:hypothetical protein